MGLFRDIVRGIVSFIPEVETPKIKVPLRSKLLWSGIVLVLYFILTEIPLYGVAPSRYDRLATFRIIFAGSQGSIVELGIGPIVTAGIILELLVGSKIIPLDLTDPDDRSFFQASQKLASILFIVVTAALYVAGGQYGVLDRRTSFLVWLQLAAGCFILMYLDEVSSKWGIASGISLFILAGIAQTVFWAAFSPFTAPDVDRVVGAIPALFTEGAMAITRGGLPDIAKLTATFIVFVAVAVAYDVKIVFPLSFARIGGYKASYPLRLLYVSNIPIIFTSALFGDIAIVSQTLWSRFGYSDNEYLRMLVRIVGEYQYVEGNLVPKGGLAYYTQPPSGMLSFSADPLRAAIYGTILITLCVVFSVIWVLTSGMDADSVADQLVSQELVMPGMRVSRKIIANRLRRYINSVTLLGGLFIGVIALLADLTGALGSGSGILLGVTITYSIYESLMKERLLEIYPIAKRFL